MIVKFKELKFLLSVFFILAFWLPSVSAANEKYQPGLILSFMPVGQEDPLGTLVDNNSTFKADSYKKEPSLVKYEGMPHWFKWEGFFNAERSGKYMFTFSGLSNSARCKFEASIANEKLFSLEGNNLHKLFGTKVLSLEEGGHKFEAHLTCDQYRNTYAAIEVKRPGYR